MFNSLTGTITGKFPQKLLLDTNGIEWSLDIPDTSLDELPSVGSIAKVYVWLQHTDTAMSLFGFATEDDRSLFFSLLKVDGIGPKGAIKIMSNISLGALSKILEEENVDALKKVPGVGTKTASKIMLQMKGKLLFGSVDAHVKIPNNNYTEVINALVGMGYDRSRSIDAVEKVLSDYSKDESFKAMPKNRKEDAVFSKSILEMAQ